MLSTFTFTSVSNFTIASKDHAKFRRHLVRAINSHNQALQRLLPLQPATIIQQPSTVNENTVKLVQHQNTHLLRKSTKAYTSLRELVPTSYLQFHYLQLASDENNLIKRNCILKNVNSTQELGVKLEIGDYDVRRQSFIDCSHDVRYDI